MTAPNPGDLHRRILLAHGNGDVRLFRNNTGQGWVGKACPVHGGLLLVDARPLHAGLCVGSSDIIGWRSVIIGQQDVGRSLAVFVAIEAKSGRARATREQRAFLEAVEKAGGLAGIARSVEDAELILGGGSR